MVASPAVRYHVDADDRLDAFNSAWTDFAKANDGSALLPDLIRGRSLWDFVSGAETVQLYRAMMTRIRAGAPKIQFPFRCDSPDRRRVLMMEIAPASFGGIVFTATPVEDDARAAVPLLDATRERSSELLTVCAWCKRARLANGDWVEVEEAVHSLGLFTADQMPRLTHGICKACSASMMPLAAGTT